MSKDVHIIHLGKVGDPKTNQALWRPYIKPTLLESSSECWHYLSVLLIFASPVLWFLSKVSALIIVLPERKYASCATSTSTFNLERNRWHQPLREIYLGLSDKFELQDSLDSHRPRKARSHDILEQKLVCIRNELSKLHTIALAELGLAALAHLPKFTIGNLLK
jgi:hypothetical protein